MEKREEYSAKESPCKYCTEHRAGCHVPECEHGWWEWHLWQQERAKEIRKKEWLESRLSIVGKKKCQDKSLRQRSRLWRRMEGKKDDTMQRDS